MILSREKKLFRFLDEKQNKWLLEVTQLLRFATIISINILRK